MAVRIKSVILWPNDMVMVFDWLGEQIAELQEPYARARLAILEQADADTVFSVEHWGDYRSRVSAQEWAALAKAAEARHHAQGDGQCLA